MNRDKMKWKGYDIELHDTGDFVAQKGEDESTKLRHETFAGVKALIDTASKKKFKRFDVFHVDRWSDCSGFQRKTVTSIDGEGSAWLIDSDGDRTKHGRGDLIIANAKNERIFNEIDALQKNRKVIDERIEKLVEKFEKIEIEDIK